MQSKFSRSSQSVRYLPALVAGLAAMVSPALSFGQAAPRVTQQVDESALVTLKGNVHPLARPQFDRGPVDDSLSGRMMLVLKRTPEQESALRELVQEQQTLGSPNYHKWLTPEQFGERFGVADADIQSVTSYLQANGFSVGRVYKNKSAIEVTGTAGQLRNTFHTQIHSYSIHGQEFFANASEPQIPAALAPVVRGFASLNNIRPTVKDESAAQSIPVTVDPETHRIKPQYTGNVGFGTFYLVTPSDLQTIYNIPTATTSIGKGGSGVTVGVIGDSQVNLDLVKRYQSLTGLPNNPPLEIVDGDDLGILGTADTTIAYEQLELLSATAPYAQINYYVSGGVSTYDTGVNFAIIRAVEDNAVSVITIGFQSCEANLTASGNALVGGSWLQAAAQGITVVAAAGDTGSAGCDTPGSTASSTGGLAVNGYASSPYDTAVGGTDFYYSTAKPATNYWNATNTATYGSAKSYIPESAWNDSSQTFDSATGTKLLYGSGGGFSTLGSVAADGVTESAYGVPSWQVTPQTLSGVLAPTARSIPDVSFFAGNGYNSSWYGICAAASDCLSAFPNASLAGGTAGSAAVFAGVMAEVVAKYGAQGNVNPTLYSMANTTGNFNRAQSGSTNTMACSSGTGCNAGYLTYNGLSAYSVGTSIYNEAVGLGSINVTTLLTNWKNPATTATTTSLAVASTSGGNLTAGASVVHGTNLDLTATVTGAGATGNVAFYAAGNPSYNGTLQTSSGVLAEPLVSGKASAPSIDLLPGGTYDLTARYGGDPTFLPSVGTFKLTVTPEPSKMYFLTGTQPIAPATTNISVTYGTQVSFTVEPFSLNNNNVTIPTGTVSVYNNYGNDPITVLTLSSEGTATFSSSLLGGSQTYPLIFEYSGDPSFQLSTTSGTPVNVKVTQATTTTTMAASGSASANTPITVSAVVASPASITTGVPPTGTVTFNTVGNGGNVVAALTGGFNTLGQAIGVATIQVTSNQIPPGGVLTGTYSSDANFSASSANITLTTNTKNYTGGTSSITGSLSSTTVATDGTLTINVTATQSNNNPAGTVQVFANGASIGSFTIAAGAGGKASWPVPLTNGYLPFPSGTVTLTAVFTPTLVTYAPSSAQTTVNVTDDHTVGDFSITTETQSVTLTSSSNIAFFKVQVTSLQNFAGLNDAIALTCTVPSNSKLGCTLGNTSINLGSSGTAITTLEVFGQPTGGTGALHPPVQPEHWWLVGGGSVLACVFILGIPARRKGLQGMMAVLMCTIIITGSITGCGSNSLVANTTGIAGHPVSNGSGTTANYTNGLAPTANTVAPGTYNIVITGTATSNTTLTHNVPLTVIMKTGIALPTNSAYTLTNFNNDNGSLLITDPSASTTAGTGMALYGADGTSDQKWIFSYQNNGYYTIQNAASLLYLTDPNGSSGSTVTVTQQPASNDGTQLWTLNAIEGGYEVVNASSAGVLDDLSFGTSPGTAVICYPQKTIIDSINQSWYINPAP